MPLTTIYRGWIGRIAFDGLGVLIGTIHALYLDTFTERPEWALVDINGGYRLVPLSGTAPYVYDSDIAMASVYTSEFIEAGPPVDLPPIPPYGGEIDAATTEQLFAHYGFDPNSPVYGLSNRIDIGYEVIPPGTVEGALITNGARLRQYLVADITQLNADP